jgi:hypothetical protein
MSIIIPNDFDIVVENFVFGTKAETLARLEGRLEAAQLCDQYFFTHSEWMASRHDVMRKITNQFSPSPLAIRSSAQGEDQGENSMAGAFDSFIGVPAGDANGVGAAIDRVFASYPEHNGRDQVLVQPCVEDVALSGVAMSREISMGGPYFVINYDDFSGRTDTVTGGAESKTMMVLRSRVDTLHSPRIVAVVRAVLELETLTGCNCLDVEFCMTGANVLCILQIRRMSMQKQWSATDVEAVELKLADARSFIASHIQRVDDLWGHRTIFSEMADWNPVEMIGSTPKPLAYSLYRSLITDSAWAVAREKMGYRKVGDRPLMQVIAGRPYIDVRLSLNSFLPEGIAEDAAAKLLDFQIAKLAQNRDLHDKIEFEIALTCLDLDFQNRCPDLVAAGLGSREIRELRERLLQMTNGFIADGPAEMDALLGQAETLSALTGGDTSDPLKRITRKLDVCRTDGVIPFAQLARHAFVAMTMMQSLRRRGLLDDRSGDRFFGSIQTVTSEFVRDLWALSKGTLKQSAFLTRYGHLRPGTYDILSPRYDESPELYFGGAPGAPRKAGSFCLSPSQARQIDTCLKDEGFTVGAEQLFSYMAEAIRARELCKFRFTRCLSDSLALLVEWGDTVGLRRDDLAYLRIEDLLAGSATEDLRAKLPGARSDQDTVSKIRLPHLIETVDDVDVIRIPIGHPTFITSTSISAPCRPIEELGQDVDGHIVLIESADPGYDWIFSHSIAGLITKFGGANSHMGIRCAEFGIPAAIGCGDRIFQRACESGYADLDCGARVIRFLRKQ